MYGFDPYGTTLGPDNAIWFTDVNGYIGRTTTQGSVTEYPIPSQSSTSGGSIPVGIAAGLDGNLWFTEQNGNRIGLITAGGPITELLPLPTPQSSPGGIVSGPDGALWFTEFNTGNIGRVDLLSHNLTEYPTPTAGSSPQGITVGPDGALWFTEQGVNQIGRITTSGMVVEYAAPPGALPYAIAAGQDLALWFTEEGTNKIARMTTGGSVTNEFPIHTVNSFPSAIVLGPDGAMWFTEQNGNNVGRVDPITFNLTEYPIPAPSNGGTGGQAIGITTGPDGALWVAAYGAGMARTAAAASSDSSTVKIVATNPPGLQVNLDRASTNSTAPVAFPWPNGSLHTLDAIVPPNGTTQYSFAGWSNLKPQSQSQTQTISAGPVPTIYVANVQCSVRAYIPSLPLSPWAVR